MFNKRREIFIWTTGGTREKVQEPLASCMWWTHGGIYLLFSHFNHRSSSRADHWADPGSCSCHAASRQFQSLCQDKSLQPPLQQVQCSSSSPLLLLSAFIPFVCSDFSGLHNCAYRRQQPVGAPLDTAAATTVIINSDRDIELVHRPRDRKHYETHPCVWMIIVWNVTAQFSSSKKL